MEDSEPGFDIKTNVTNFLMDDVFNSCKSNPNFDFEASLFMLVVDNLSCKILNSFVQYTDLMEKGIAGIERIELRRKEFPKMHAIYFLSPTIESVDLLNDDFDLSSDKTKTKKRMYGYIHLIFTNTVSDEVFEHLMSKTALHDYIVNIKQINLQFVAHDETTFTLQMDGVLGNLYTPKHTEKKEETIQAIASKLTTILTSLKDFYNVQILYSKGEKSAAKPIAESLQKNIDKLLAVKGSTTPVSKPAPVTFIVMDRTKDPMTPLKHDLYYNSLIMDLLDIRDSKYEFETINEKKQKSIKISNLNSSDKIWMDNRLSPYMKALTVIVQGFNSFLANNSAAKMQQGKIEDLNIEKMGEIIKAMPHYQDMLGVYSFHINMLERCGELFKRREIDNVANMEAVLTAGNDQQWKPKQIKNAALVSNCKFETDVDRLILLMNLSQHCDSDVSRKALSSLSPEGQKIHTAMKEIGLAENSFCLPVKEFEKNSDNKFADLDRSMSILAESVIQLRSGKSANEFGTLTLPAGEEFPSIKVRAGQAIGSKTLGGSNKNSNAPIIIAFVIGGISINEIRELRSIEESKQTGGHVTIMGGTSYYTAHGYFEELLRVHGPLKKDLEKQRKEKETLDPEPEQEAETDQDNKQDDEEEKINRPTTETELSNSA